MDYRDAPALVQKFLSYKLTIQNRSKLTVFQYYHDLRTFSRFLLVRRYPEQYQDREMNEIPFSDADDKLLLCANSEDLFAFLTYAAADRDNKANSRARKLSALRSFYQYLFSVLMVIPENPAAKIESPKRNQSLPKYLSLEESKGLLDAVDGQNAARDYAILTLFLNCGMRVSELCSIDLSDFDREFNYVTVTGKGNKQRILYLNDSCRDAVKAYLKVRPTDCKPEAKHALFISRNRNRISVKTVQWLTYKYLNHADLANKHLSVHKLRHTAATLMYAYGNTDVRVLKEILGHEDLSTTQIYTHVENSQLMKAAENNPLNHVARKKKPSPQDTDAK